MHNLLTPIYARKQAQQRWLYSAIACVCVILGFIQLRHALTKTPALPEAAVAHPFNEVPEPTIPASIFEPSAPEINSSVLSEMDQELAMPDPCADLTPPNYQVAAVLWQQQGEILVLKTPEGKHLQITIGKRLEQSKWRLQSIDKLSIVWQHEIYLCGAEQAINAHNKQLLSY